MPQFGYIAKNTDGRQVEATMEAASRMEALLTLRQQGLTVVNLMEASKSAVAGMARPVTRRARARGRQLQDVKPPGGRTRVTLSDVSAFCRLLATSVNAGIPLRDAVESIAEDVENKSLTRILNSIVCQLHEGQSFSEALAHYEAAFGTVFVSLVRSAEEAGSMSETLTQLAGYLERTERIRRKIQSVTAYPLFVLVFFCIVCVIMTLFVIPKFSEIFAGFDAPLPRLTIIVFGVNGFLLDNLLPISALLVAGIVLIMVWRQTEAGKMQIDRWKLRLPFVGEILRKYAIARLCRSLALMIRGGVPVTTAFEIAAQVAGNRVLHDSLVQVKDRIISGSDIAGSLRQDAQFPRLFVRMVNVGENSGRLSEVMLKLSDVYEEQVEGQIAVVTALLEPMIICVFGAFVLLLILAIYMPVFTVASKM